MQTILNTGPFITFIKRNWFKISIAVILIYAAMRKDFSFRINLNSPVQIENPGTTPKPPARKAKEKQTQERYTENFKEEKLANPNPSSRTDQFNFAPSLSLEEKEEKRNYEQQLEMTEESLILAFIERFNRVARAEEEKFGIPAPIVLANGLLSSLAGQQKMTRQGNNYFGLTCTEDWLGDSSEHEGQCYRHYENAWTSFRDHSLYLTTGKLAQLKQLGSEDYVAWAKAIEKAGIGMDDNWAEQLINVIRTYHLDRE